MLVIYTVGITMDGTKITDGYLHNTGTLQKEKVVIL